MFFIGKYYHNLDDKSRIILPSKLRDKLGSTVYCTLGLDKCIAIYPEESFLAIVQNLSQLSNLQKDQREYKRAFFANSIECEIDKQGRIQLTKEALEKVGITKECVIIGIEDHVELWDKQKYLDVEANDDANYEVNAAHVDIKYSGE